MVWCGFLALLFLCDSVVSGEQCTIKDEQSTVTGDTREHQIVIQCGGYSRILFTMRDSATESYLRLDDVRDGVAAEWLEVDYTAASEGDMYITIEGARYNVRDGLEQEEHEKMLQLFAEHDFMYFPASTKLIHDELKLKGWQSLSVLCLYTIAIAAQNQEGNSHNAVEKRQTETVEERHLTLNLVGIGESSVDPHTYWYHGKWATKQCKANGWNTRYLRTLLRRDCAGICGPSCHTCWEYLCGDCCFHKGCKRHDKFCDNYFSADCLTVRGILWDTLTTTDYDC